MKSRKETAKKDTEESRKTVHRTATQFGITHSFIFSTIGFTFLSSFVKRSVFILSFLHAVKYISMNTVTVSYTGYIIYINYYLILK